MSILTESDAEILDSVVKDLRKYDWVKDSLLNNKDLKISPKFRELIQTDAMKQKIESMCSEQPPMSDEGELPFTNSEIFEIKSMIEHFHDNGVRSEDIVQSVISEININGSDSLKDTWQTLNEEFNGSHKYYYLAREYLQNTANDLIKNLIQEDEGMGR